MTARYVVRLYLDANPTARVERAIRRDDDDRAVLYARNWLFRHQLSMRYLGIAFDRWSVEVEREAGLTFPVAQGTQDQPVPAAGTRPSPKARPPAKMSSRGKIESLRVIDRRFGRSTPARPMSRLAQAVALAKQKVANNGDVPPVGGDTNRQR